MNAEQNYALVRDSTNFFVRTVLKPLKIPPLTYEGRIPVPVELAIEIWRPIPGCERWYEVSTKGRVCSVTHPQKGQKKTRLNENGYERVALFFEGKQKHLFVHRLVAIAFIPNPLNLPYVNHLDSNPLNNTWCNLEWTTPLGNAAHALKYGRASSDKRKPQKSKLIGKQIVSDYYGPAIEFRPTIKVLSQKYDISSATVERILSLHRKTLGVKMRTAEQNKAIVMDYISRKSNGLKISDIALKHSMTATAVRRVYARSKKHSSSSK